MPPRDHLTSHLACGTYPISHYFRTSPDWVLKIDGTKTELRCPVFSTAWTCTNRGKRGLEMLAIQTSVCESPKICAVQANGNIGKFRSHSIPLLTCGSQQRCRPPRRRTGTEAPTGTRRDYAGHGSGRDRNRLDCGSGIAGKPTAVQADDPPVRRGALLGNNLDPHFGDGCLLDVRRVNSAHRFAEFDPLPGTVLRRPLRSANHQRVCFRRDGFRNWCARCARSRRCRKP